MPIKTKNIPMICSSQICSPKNTVAKKILKIGSMLAIIEAFPEQTYLLHTYNINDGKTVEKKAIDNEII